MLFQLPKTVKYILGELFASTFVLKIPNIVLGITFIISWKVKSSILIFKLFYYKI